MLGTVIVAVTLLKPALLSGRWSYTAFGAAKKPIVTGTLTLEPAPQFGKNGYRGVKQLVAVGSKGPAKRGQIDGTLQGAKVNIDLDSGTADNNILLNGILKGDRITGTWGHSTIAGIRERGTFEMKRLK